MILFKNKILRKKGPKYLNEYFEILQNCSYWFEPIWTYNSKAICISEIRKIKNFLKNTSLCFEIFKTSMEFMFSLNLCICAPGFMKFKRIKIYFLILWNSNYHFNSQGYFGNLICVKIIKMSFSWFILHDTTHIIFFWILFEFKKNL